jgi:CheY-like chemotaxis protein
MKITSPYFVLVEDNEDVSALVLRALGYVNTSLAPVVCKTEPELRGVLESALAGDGTLPRFVLLDLYMTPVGGLTMLQNMRQIRALQDLPVVIFSASAAPQQIESSYRHGASGYVEKPSNFNDFKSVLGAIFARWSGEGSAAVPALSQALERRYFRSPDHLGGS